MKGFLFLIIISLFFVSCSTTETVDLSNYIEITLAGTEGDGYIEDISYNDQGTNILLNTIKEKNPNISDLEVLDFLLSFNPMITSADQGLSNGDEVTYDILYDENRAKEYGVDITPKSGSYTVQGLEEVEEISLIDKIHVIFSGYDPYIKAEIDASNVPLDYKDHFKAELTSSENNNRINGQLKNGEEIQLKISSIPNDENIRVIEESARIIVLGEGSYPRELTKEQIEPVIEKLEVAIEEKIQNDILKRSVPYEDIINIYSKNIETQNYQLTRETVYHNYSDERLNENLLRVIFKLEAQGEILTDNSFFGMKKGDLTETTNYYIVSGENLIIDNDGRIIIENMKIDISSAYNGDTAEVKAENSAVSKPINAKVKVIE